MTCGGFNLVSNRNVAALILEYKDSYNMLRDVLSYDLTQCQSITRYQ